MSVYPADPASYAREIRLRVLETSKRANVGHIGSALSVADIVAGLYCGPLKARDDRRDDRPRFVVSKGHATLAVYAALQIAGTLDRATLDTYCSDGSMLGVHPEHAVVGIDFSTGSLGHGLSYGVGAALAGRLAGDDRLVYVLLSDGECNEGSVWEAAMFAAHHGLANLVAIVDLNGQQALGYLRDILDAGSLPGRWRECGWEVVEVDGHDHELIRTSLLPSDAGSPRVVIARTTFGKGVTFMESRVEWHYLPMDDQQYVLATHEIRR